MSNQLISRVETITPVLAEEYLKHNTSNRQLRKNIVQYYAKQMANGQWMLNGEGIIFNEQGTLVDGQHRLAAVVESGTNVEMLVIRNADKDSFATIDSGVSRKIQDTFFVKGIPNATIVCSIISKYYSLSNLWNDTSANGRKKDGKTISRQDMLKIYSDDEDFWQEMVSQAQMCYMSMKLLAKSEIGGYMAYLIKAKKHDREKVYEFFEDLLKVDIPQNKMLAALRRRLINDKSSTTHMGGVYRQQLIIKIWNHYITGKETTLMRWNEEQEGKKDFK